MFFLPLIGSNQIMNLILMKFSTWRASIVLNWLSLYSYSYFVLSVCSVYIYDINLFTFHVIKQRQSCVILLIAIIFMYLFNDYIYI